MDHRLVRDHHIEQLTHEAAALYLFLVTVADGQGLSYYSDDSLQKRLTMDTSTITSARNCLAGAGLVAYKKPLYQVLALSDAPIIPQKSRTVGVPTAIAEILKSLAGGVR